MPITNSCKGRFIIMVVYILQGASRLLFFTHTVHVNNFLYPFFQGYVLKKRRFRIFSNRKPGYSEIRRQIVSNLALSTAKLYIDELFEPWLFHKHKNHVVVL